MAWAKPTTITAWSFSRWKVYEECPLKAKLKFIDKIPEPSSPAMERGTAIHKRAEEYVSGTIRSAPAEIKSLKVQFKEIRDLNKSSGGKLTTIEDTWAFRRDWSRTTWNDWDGCWLRVKLDMAHVDGNTVFVSDVKTGKFSKYNLGDYGLQLEIYGLAALLVHASIGKDLEVKPRLLYVDHGVVHPEPASLDEIVYVPSDVPALKKAWEARVKPMLTDQKFAPKPNNNCKWCAYRASAGGTCKFG